MTSNRSEMVERPDEGSMRFLLKMVEADIEREGDTASFLVRAGLLRDILKFVLAAPNQPLSDSVVERRERLVEAWLVSRFNNAGWNSGYKPQWDPETCSAEDYVSYIREHKPFALQRAYQMADWAIEAAAIPSAGEAITKENEDGTACSSKRD